MPLIEVRDAKEGTNGRKLTFSSKKLLANGSYEDETIAIITISDRTKTTLRIQLKRGTITLDIPQDSHHYPVRHALPVPGNGNSHTLQEVNQFISAEASYPRIIHYLKVDKFKFNGVNNENCFYLKDPDKVVYIPDSTDLKFNQVKLMFYNDKYVFYQGDITFSVLNEHANQTLKQVFWISLLNTNQVHRIYLPIVHLMDHQQDVKTSSTMIQTQVLEKGILFKQQFTDYSGKKTIFLTYLIDTTKTSDKLYLLEIEGQGLSDQEQQTLKNSDINQLKKLMKNLKKYQWKEQWGAGAQPLEDPKYTALKLFSPLEIKEALGISTATKAIFLPPQLPQNTSSITIGDRLIWPMPNSLKGVTGTITARIAAATLDNAKYHIHLVGIVPGTTAADHYYYWQVTEADNYNQFHALYLQHADNNAEEIDLLRLGLTKKQIKNITGANKGVYLHRRDGLRAYLTSHSLEDGTLLNANSASAVAATQTSITRFGQFLLCKEDKIYLGHANERQGVWMLDSPITREKVIRYLPGENITAEMFSYNGKPRGINTLLSNAVILPASSTEESETGKLPYGEKVDEASMAANGSLQVITTSGLVLAVTVNTPSNPPDFTFDLIGVTTVFSRKYQQKETQIKTLFSGIFSKLTLPEIITLPYDQQTDWYHPKSQTLFIPRSHAPYLGCNTASKTAYFSTTNSAGDRAQLRTATTQISATASYTGTSDFASSGHYSRQGDILMLNADHIDQPHDYFSLDGVSHFLLQIRQPKTEAFTFELKLLPYPVIGLFHDADRQVICKIDATITPQKVLMKRQNTALCLSIGTKWLVINDAFAPMKPNLDKLKFTFTYDGIQPTAQQLVNHYIKTLGEQNITDRANAGIKIPILLSA
ncbi:hypothetical protein SK355_11475 [Candidatus Fukatsuia symbiotica]|uniref:Uncharacterized protein n=1 Tax=Candidatus Fukatsuia symbiotica TaxID=1878942 RepID=A0A2U8I402_9GAMM|nr:hypothetical protein [Candidatus Fukatsuia symbiotica]AWK13870.1 hypothetical protein CCS41_04295 [Candidatus Fukatsuia symbiotica]MEA9445801.1 hypothetical protein [Candidatus Fukatsuia symbiotica]